MVTANSNMEGGRKRIVSSVDILEMLEIENAEDRRVRRRYGYVIL